MHRQRPNGCPHPLVSLPRRRARRRPLGSRRRAARPVAPALGLVAARAHRGCAVLLAPGGPGPTHPDLVRLARRARLLRHRAGVGPGLQLVRRTDPRPGRGAVLRGRRRLHPARPRPGARLRGRLHPGRGVAHGLALRWPPTGRGVPGPGRRPAPAAGPRGRSLADHGRRLRRRRGPGHADHLGPSHGPGGEPVRARSGRSSPPPVSSPWYWPVPWPPTAGAQCARCRRRSSKGAAPAA